MVVNDGRGQDMAKNFVKLVDGLQLKDENAFIELKNDYEFLILEEKKLKFLSFETVNTFRIPIANIIDAAVTTVTELVEKDKSVVGRGVVGGLIFGPAGLVLGGLSGVGKKTKKKVDIVYIVSYLSKENEIKNITFSLPGDTFGAVKKFAKNFKKILDETKRSEEVSKILNQSEQDEFIL